MAIFEQSQRLQGLPQVGRLLRSLGGVSGGVLTRNVVVIPSNITVVACERNTAVATSTNISISPTAGNALVVAVTSYLGNNANHAMSDNIDGTTGWVKLGGTQNGNFDPPCASLWVKFNVPSGITTLTCTGGVDTLITIAIAHEVSGITTFTGGEAGTNAQLPTTNPETASVTNVTAASIFFAVLTNADGANPAQMDINGTGTVGTWNLFNANSQYLNGAVLYPVSMPNYIASSSASTKHGWTTASRGTATVIAAFH